MKILVILFSIIFFFFFTSFAHASHNGTISYTPNLSANAYLNNAVDFYGGACASTPTHWQAVYNMQFNGNRYSDVRPITINSATGTNVSTNQGNFLNIYIKYALSNSTDGNGQLLNICDTFNVGAIGFNSTTAFDYNFSGFHPEPTPSPTPSPTPTPTTTPTPTPSPTPTPTPTPPAFYYGYLEIKPNLAHDLFLNSPIDWYPGGCNTTPTRWQWQISSLTNTYFSTNSPITTQLSNVDIPTNQGLLNNLILNFSTSTAIDYRGYSIDTCATASIPTPPLYPDTATIYYITNSPPPVNNAPEINHVPDATVNEGATYSSNGSFTDPDSISWTATVDYGDGSGVQNLPLNGTNFTLAHMYKDNGSYTVTVTVTDDLGKPDTEDANVTVNNVAPIIDSIVVSPSTPIQVNNSISASAPFEDDGILDTHTASWDWGDGNISPDTVTESNGLGSVTENHVYANAGVYTITLTITDNDNTSSSQVFQYVSVYDPTPQGLFTGNRIFASPAGAYPQNPNLSGQVFFGATARYQGTTPTGNVSMDFKTANLEFEATSLTVLVTSNGQATLRGTGTINGSGNYNFLITGLDAAQDAIRFQIKDQSQTIIFDSQLNAADTATPTSSVTGQVIVH